MYESTEIPLQINTATQAMQTQSHQTKLLIS